MKILYIVLCCLAAITQLTAQATTNVPLNDLNHHIQTRLEIKSGNFGGIHTTAQPIGRKSIRSYIDTIIDSSYWQQTSQRQAQYQYLINDNNDEDTSVVSKRPFLKLLYPNKEKSFLGHFYRSPAHLLEIRKPNFYVNINPILHFKAAYESYNGTTGLVFLNRRGAVIRGNIAERVYFHTDIIESQASFPTYVQQIIARDNAVPGAGYFKEYNSSFRPDSTDGVDYLLATGYVGFELLKNHIGVQLGHGQNFIGDGHRSLFLSDYSPNYFYIKLNTKVWRLQYQNIFAQLTQNYTTRQRAFDLAFGRKYLAAHHLSINILDNLNIGLFEGVIFSRGGQFDLQYINPLIFYRAVEQAAGSPDNVMVGLNWKWNFLGHFSFYGQAVLDELAIGSLAQNGAGWWGNKFAFQVGLKYIDAFGVDQLDIQGEVNLARPFTYTFRDSTANWTHYNQPLAHPLGANFYELIGIVNYQPLPNLYLRAQLNYAVYGQDEPNTNWGGNVHKPYTTRQLENGNAIGQGVTTQLLLLQFLATYQLRHNLFADLQLTYRRADANIDAYDSSTLLLGVGLRWNISEKMKDW